MTVMLPLAARHAAFGCFRRRRKQRGERRGAEKKDEACADQLAKQPHIAEQAYYDTLAKKRRMDHFQHRLGELRDEVARTDRKYASPQRPAAFRYIEEWLTGEEVETSFGRHFETEKLYEAHRRHGSADIGALAVSSSGGTIATSAAGNAGVFAIASRKPRYCAAMRASAWLEMIRESAARRINAQS